MDDHEAEIKGRDVMYENAKWSSEMPH